MGEPMMMDAVRRIYDHVRRMQGEDIDLFIHSDGGDATVPWRLVNVIRECASKFSVLVPHHAFSAATLTALGADEVVMHRMGVLGPTDPNVRNEYNPKDEHTKRPLGINVEDVTAYLQLIKQDAGIQHQDELVLAFNILAEKVHPLALGNVKRFLVQSRMMAKKLLSLHMKETPEEHKIDELVDAFTAKLYYHGHPIGRIEARDEIGLPTIAIPGARLEANMWALYLEYEKEMRLETEFDPGAEFLGEFPNLKPKESATTKSRIAKSVYIESSERADVKEQEYRIYGEKQKDGSINFSVNVLAERWSQE